MDDVQGDTRDWYQQYYAAKGADRNDLLTNPEVLFQYLAMQASVIAALRAAPIDRSTAKVLDVGCGDGGSLALLLPLKFRARNLYGIDILDDRIQIARDTYGGMQFIQGDAASMDFDGSSFDLTMAFTMFVQLTDEVLATRIAREMWRVTKPGGCLLLVDWRYGKPRNPNYVGLPLRRIRQLFPAAQVEKQHRGQMIPPIGRLFSKYLPACYFAARALFPFLAGSMATLLRKPIIVSPGEPLQSRK